MSELTKRQQIKLLEHACDVLEDERVRHLPWYKRVARVLPLVTVLTLFLIFIINTPHP